MTLVSESIGVDQMAASNGAVSHMTPADALQQQQFAMQNQSFTQGPPALPSGFSSINMGMEDDHQRLMMLQMSQDPAVQQLLDEASQRDPGLRAQLQLHHQSGHLPPNMFNQPPTVKDVHDFENHQFTFVESSDNE